MTLSWEVASILVGFLVLYTKVIYDYASLKKDMGAVREVLVEIKVMMASYDNRIDSLETRLTKLETKHEQHHGG